MILLSRRNSIVAAALISLLDPQEQVLPKLRDDSNASQALILGGFLLPSSAYEIFSKVLIENGYSTSILAYDDPRLTQTQTQTQPSPIGNYIPPEIQSWSPSLLLGHSKGAKTIAEWIPYWVEESTNPVVLDPRNLDPSIKKPPAIILMEPVDVVPPGKEPYGLLERDWKPRLKAISQVPTLIVAAPYTDTSRRYGKAKNLCAPPGKDARAFYELALEARKEYPDAAAPLKYVEFENLGHNDVIITSKDASAIGGCANGPDRAIGAQLVTEQIREWLELLEREKAKH